MSRESEHRYKDIEHSSSSESLPEQWESVQKRLDHLESSLLKLNKRSQKFERRLHQQNQDLQTTRKEIRILVEEVLQEHSNQLSFREKELQIQNMRAELDDLHGYIKRVEKKSNEMVKEIKSGGIPSLTDSRIEDKIEDRVQRMMQKHQSQTTKAIAELRRMVSSFAKAQGNEFANKQPQFEYPRDQRLIERKSSEKVLSNSKSKVNVHTSNQKSYRASYTDIPNQDASIDRHSKSKTSQPQPQPQPLAQTQPNASSRVSYLREKLKEFEQANKKFQQKIQKKGDSGTPKSSDKRTVQKLKDFKNYLQQSESQVDQSNLQANPHNVLTDSIKNWKNGDRYRYE